MDTSSPHLPRRRRGLVVLSLVVTIAVACTVAPATAAASAPSQHHAVAAGAPWSQVIKLLRTMVARSRPVVSSYVKTNVKSVARSWTRQQLNNWYCSRWDQYFGYDRRVWHYWASRYYGPNFAWRYCAAVGYF